ncbi:hypothetical protein P43SY_012101 [Pythium insidiosum]|uniref:Uncharacterized protein n=1 Tax=Pythium insidiosum TaxID=114742 RepID=A0AAD5M0M8_PYTIN|nr:hypothetical protein P43SY_012101 [Pythium insidiosum]
MSTTTGSNATSVATAGAAGLSISSKCRSAVVALGPDDVVEVACDDSEEKLKTFSESMKDVLYESTFGLFASGHSPKVKFAASDSEKIERLNLYVDKSNTTARLHLSFASKSLTGLPNLKYLRMHRVSFANTSLSLSINAALQNITILESNLQDLSFTFADPSAPFKLKFFTLNKTTRLNAEQYSNAKTNLGDSYAVLRFVGDCAPPRHK